MKNRFSAIYAIILLTLLSGSVTADELWNSFTNPLPEARTKVWWFHGETETTREGIDADLRAFKDAGLGGVVFYDQTHGKQEGAFPSLSEKWWKSLKYAALKANESGLTFDMAATNGYVAGGPWITQDYCMKKIVVVRQGEEKPEGFIPLKTVSRPISSENDYTDTLILKNRLNITDNKPVIIAVDFNEPKELRSISFTVSPRGKGAYGSMNIPGKPQKEYFGAKYISFPPLGELEYSIDGIRWAPIAKLRGIEDVIGHKSKQRTLNFLPVTAKHFRLNIHDWQGDSTGNNRLYLENIRLMSYDMTDNWETKSGLRSELLSECEVKQTDGFRPFSGEMTIGYAPTGGYVKHGRSKIVWDNKELSSGRWPEADVLSADAAELHYNSYFKAILDTLSQIGVPPSGMQMDSHEAGIANWTQKMPEHFKRLRGYDIDPWIEALGGFIVGSREATDNFLKDFKLTVSDLVREQFYSTFDSLCRRDGVIFTSQAMLGCANDNIASRGAVEKPQGEFWAYQENGNYDCLDAASAAHLYGKRIASAEAFTDTPYFLPQNPADSTWKERGWHQLLRIANLAYCKGINEFAVCASSFQPSLTQKYNDDTSAHPYIFHRLNPAWDKSREHFWDYQARCAQLLRTGKPVVDILVLIGEDLPAKTMTFKLPEIPEGYNFDVCTPTSLRHWMEHNDSLTPDYKFLAVQDRSVISPKSELLISQLEKRGMKVIRCDRGESVAEALDKHGLKRDILINSENKPDSKVHFCHRQTDDAEIYFIYNHSVSEYNHEIVIRSDRSDFEVWNPLTLEKSVAPRHLSLMPYEAVFLIAR